MENLIDFSTNKYLKIEDTVNKGRAVIAKQDIPAFTTILTEKPLFYFDSTLHPPSLLTCEVCLKFYGDNEQAIQEIKTSFRGHLGYVHLLASIMLASEEEREIFFQLAYCPTDIDKSLNLKETKELIEKYKGWDEEKQQIFDRLVSNSQGQTDPPDCGTYMKQSMVNHSCNNNCFYFIENRVMHLRSIKDIKQGEEVTYSYIRNLYQPRTFRQLELAYRGFKCMCSRCQNSAESVRVWNCPVQDCKGEFTPLNNSSIFNCKRCGHQEEYLQKAKQAEKTFDMEILHKKHFKMHKDMDQNLRDNGFAIPEDLYEVLALQLIENNNSLCNTDHHPENISLYDVLGQRFAHAQQEDKTQYYFEKAHIEAQACFGKNSKQANLQQERAKNPPKQCSIF